MAPVQVGAVRAIVQTSFLAGQDIQNRSLYFSSCKSETFESLDRGLVKNCVNVKSTTPTFSS